eukprot:3375262-Pleurochrysis_carterae.AAC.2
MSRDGQQAGGQGAIVLARALRPGTRRTSSPAARRGAPCTCLRHPRRSRRSASSARARLIKGAAWCACRSHATARSLGEVARRGRSARSLGQSGEQHEHSAKRAARGEAKKLALTAYEWTQRKETQ